MAYQALIFDAGGVFIPHDNDALVRRLAGRCAAPEAASRIEGLWSNDLYGTGQLPVRHLHERLTRELGYEAPWETFVEDWSAHLDVDLEMVGLIEALSRAHRVLVFSNTTAEHWERCATLTSGRLQSLETFLSHEIGDVKPRLSAFRLVAERAGLDTPRCLFIDDRLDNVEGARQAGFQAVQFTDQASLAAHLREAGVTWPQAAEMEQS